MDQCHGLKDFLTKGWLPDQFNDLCKTLKILRVKPMDRVRMSKRDLQLAIFTMIYLEKIIVFDYYLLIYCYFVYKM